MTPEPDTSAADRVLVDCYERLLRVLREEPLDPFQRGNAVRAAAALRQAANGILPCVGYPDDVAL